MIDGIRRNIRRLAGSIWPQRHPMPEDIERQITAHIATLRRAREAAEGSARGTNDDRVNRAVAELRYLERAARSRP